MDMDTDLATDTEVVICIRICGIRIHVSGGFFVPVSNTTRSSVATLTSDDNDDIEDFVDVPAIH